MTTTATSSEATSYGAAPKQRRPLMSIVDAMLQNIEENDGAVTDELDALELELADKVDAYKAVTLQLEAEAKALKDVAANYATRAKARENAAEALRERLAYAMQLAGIDNIKGQTCKASFRSSTSVRLADEAAFMVGCEDRFVKVTSTLRKQALKEALEAGEKVDGAELVTTRHLVLR